MLLSIACILIALILLPGTIDLIFVTLGACIPKKKSHEPVELVNAVIVVPAYNEEKSIDSTLKSLQQIEGKPHVIVVADNCTDQTASIARGMGVEVLERFSEIERGKPYALREAFRHLLERDFDWFIVVDADTSVEPDFLKELSSGICSYDAKAVQARYCVRNASESSKTRLMGIAFYSQYLRMRGRERLGCSTGIQGNGFALHREVVESVPIKAQYIAEDLAYHLELVMSRYVVRYRETAAVFADMPVTSEGLQSQRSRWEGGRLRVVLDYLPQLFRRILSGNYYCLEPLLDLLLLPLGYHLLGILIFMVVSGFSWLSLLFLTVPIIHVFLSILLGGGTREDFFALATVPYYLFWKLVHIGETIKSSKKKTSWIRTDRGGRSK